MQRGKKSVEGMERCDVSIILGSKILLFILQIVILIKWA